ncbi:SDR family NAD(P)-dependent oxidoreductase [Stieleria varia]|uniref:3-oxoacyl-[acyl-carrier-protein] reductase FabG n=1 Tax=Stieleria varia TaxID=2528005 RepID=A0A5C6B917_9BACT|nr:SDR family oxidoreductase [Stieleria varia]TWU07931.1 3-oxoacyl-[acyl-carrier-protein] reductase FabG [Stieleria varia]
MSKNVVSKKPDSSEFRGARVVVTGASSGIGQAIAVRTANSGASSVLVHYRKNREGAEQTAEMLRQQGTEVFLTSADLSDPDQAEQLVDAAWNQLGHVTTWVNNAGADVLTSKSAELDFQSKLRLLLEVDLVNTIGLSRLVADRMLKQTAAVSGSNVPPSMTFIGWDQAPAGMEGDAGQMFGPVKAAVMAYANSLAQTLSPHVRVNTVAPGWIQTAWGQSTSEYWNQRARSQSLMARWGTPQDVARAVCFLAAPGNTFCTGQTLNVNGGWNRRPDHLGGD